MEKKNKMARVYGYLVCLVTVITFIIAVAGIVESILDLQDPLHSGRYPQNAPSLASYNNYKMDILKAPEKTTASFTPDDATLKAMYDSAKSDWVAKVKHEANRSVIVNSVLIILCVALFLLHWIWLRRLDKAENATIEQV
jgi:hypothetical protein